MIMLKVGCCTMPSSSVAMSVGVYCVSNGINTEEKVAVPLPPEPSSLGSHWEQQVVHMSVADLRTCSAINGTEFKPNTTQIQPH